MSKIKKQTKYQKETEKKLCNFLMKIERGEITLKACKDPQKVFAGNVHYIASNGWEITIFNDCNQFDYIDSIKCPRGIIDYNILSKMELIEHYDPSDEVAWRRYGIPGYCKFRCVKCDRIILKYNQCYFCSNKLE